MFDGWAGFIKLVEENENRVFVACAGEEAYPNVSVRGVQTLEGEAGLFYADDRTSRTVQLMKASPRVLVFVYDWTSGKGIKGKGEATFHDDGPWHVRAREQFLREGRPAERAIGVIIHLKDFFPF